MTFAQHKDGRCRLLAGFMLAAACALAAWDASARCRSRCSAAPRCLSGQQLARNTNATNQSRASRAGGTAQVPDGDHHQAPPAGGGVPVFPASESVRANEQRWDQYQDQVLAATAKWRIRPIAESHQMTASFFDFWTLRRAQGRIIRSRIYLPIDWFECIYKCTPDAQQELRDYFHALDRSFSYFTLFGFDCGMHRMGFTIAMDLDILVYSSNGCTRGARDVRIPLMSDVLEPSGVVRDIRVSAAFSERSHPVRTQLARVLETWSTEPGFVWTNITSKAEYADLLRRSNFTLCPRGLGPTSYRFYEALQVGTIPIFIWKYDAPLAFPELVDWNEVAIICNADELHTLQQGIATFDVPRAQLRLRQLAHMWTYSFINEYVMRRLEAEALWPVPKSPYSAM